jgi:hypothetical protein
MDPIFGICQALGIGIAVGALCGAPGLGGNARGGLLALAAVLGALAGGISASSDDVSTVGGAVAGAAAALLACAVVSDIVAGAGRRGGGGAGGIGLLVVLAAIVVAGLSILLGPLALIALAGLLWLAIARRRRSQRKYEGLRVLR